MLLQQVYATSGGIDMQIADELVRLGRYTSNENKFVCL